MRNGRAVEGAEFFVIHEGACGFDCCKLLGHRDVVGIVEAFTDGTGCQVTPAILPCAGSQCSGCGPPPAAAPLPGQDCQASTRGRPRASRPSPPALRPPDPKEHWQSPPPAVPWRCSVARGGPSSPRISPRRNDRQRYVPRPCQCKKSRSADQAGSIA